MQIAEMFQADLAEIGVDVEVLIVPWATYLADTAAGKHDMFILGWVTVTADPDYGLYALFHSSSAIQVTVPSTLMSVLTSCSTSVVSKLILTNVQRSMQKHKNIS